MMSRMGGDTIQKMNERNKFNKNQDEESTNMEPQKVSKFIIDPKNYWNMQWNNFTQIVFMAWIIITPIMVS